MLTMCEEVDKQKAMVEHCRELTEAYHKDLVARILEEEKNNEPI